MPDPRDQLRFPDLHDLGNEGYEPPDHKMPSALGLWLHVDKDPEIKTEWENDGRSTMPSAKEKQGRLKNQASKLSVHDKKRRGNTQQ